MSVAGPTYSIASGLAFVGRTLGVVGETASSLANIYDNSAFLKRVDEAAFDVLTHARDPMATVVQLALLPSKPGVKVGFGSYQVILTQGLLQFVGRMASGFNHHQLKQLENDVLLALHRYKPWENPERRIGFIYALEGLNYLQTKVYPGNTDVEKLLTPAKGHIYTALTKGTVEALPVNSLKEGMDKWKTLVERLWAAKNSEIALLKAKEQAMKVFLESVLKCLSGEKAADAAGDAAAAKPKGKAAEANDAARKLLEAKLRELQPAVASVNGAAGAAAAAAAVGNEADVKAYDDKMPPLPTWQECHAIVESQWTDDEFRILHKDLTGKNFTAEADGKANAAKPNTKLLTEGEFEALKEGVKLPADMRNLNLFVEMKIEHFAKVMNVALEALATGRTFHDLWAFKKATKG